MQINSFGLKEKICYIMYFAEASILGGGGGTPNENIGEGETSFPPPPHNFVNLKNCYVMQE